MKKLETRELINKLFIPTKSSDGIYEIAFLYGCQSEIY